MNGTIYHGDALDFLSSCEHQRCMIADVFDNIGLDYNGFKDKMPDATYHAFVASLLARAVSKSDIFWFTYNQKHDLWIKPLINNLVKTRSNEVGFYKQVIWSYTFGQYIDDGLTSCYRPLVCLAKPGIELNYNGIRVRSARQELGDLRAAGPKVPSDVWEFPRIVGNAKERRAWHPTQLPEAMLTRILILSCMWTEHGHTAAVRGALESGTHVTDLFLGSGTTGIVAKQLGLKWAGVEKSDEYVGELKKLLQAEISVVQPSKSL